MQTKYPHHIALVHSNDEYSDEPTHCSFEVRPSILLKFAWYLALARLMKFLAKSSSELRFLFWEVIWLNFVEEDNLLGQETVRKMVEEGGFADEDQISLSFNPCEESLRGHEVQMYPEGALRFLCFNKHSGVEFSSDEISLRKLFTSLRFEHVLMEVEHWRLEKRSLMFLRSLREKGL
jgi:hypothetical protein